MKRNIIFPNHNFVVVFILVFRDFMHLYFGLGPVYPQWPTIKLITWFIKETPPNKESPGNTSRKRHTKKGTFFYCHDFKSYPPGNYHSPFKWPQFGVWFFPFSKNGGQLLWHGFRWSKSPWGGPWLGWGNRAWGSHRLLDLLRWMVDAWMSMSWKLGSKVTKRRL